MDDRKDRLTMAEAMNRMLSALRGWGTNNAAAQGGIYQGAGPQGWSTNNAAAQGGIYGGGQMTDQDLPRDMQDQWARSGQITQMEPDGPMTDADMRPHRGTPMQGMHRGYDYDAVGRFGEEAYREGPNQNIDEDTRLRALAEIARRYQGG